MAMRLPAHLEVAALLRQTAAAGGFAAVLRKGERDGGSIVVVLTHNGAPGRLFERLPRLDGTRPWTLVRAEAPNDPQFFADYLARRCRQDPDLWVVELDIPDAERFIGFEPSAG